MAMNQPPKLKYVATKTLVDNWSYITVEGQDVIIGVKQTVNKVMMVVDDNNKPILGGDGLPQFSVFTTTIVKGMSKEEWIVEKQMKGFAE